MVESQTAVIRLGKQRERHLRCIPIHNSIMYGDRATDWQVSIDGNIAQPVGRNQKYISFAAENTAVSQAKLLQACQVLALKTAS